MSTTTEESRILGLTPAEMQAVLIEFGLLKERERHRAEEQARLEAEREAADEERRRNDIANQPMVTVEWERYPQEHSCNVGGRRYYGRGPTISKATGRKVRPGQRMQMPACDAVVLDEAGFVTVVEGREHCVWTPVPFLPGVVDNLPDPGDDKAWKDLVA